MKKYCVYDRPIKSNQYSGKPHPIKPKKAKFWIYRGADGVYFYNEANKRHPDWFVDYCFGDAGDAYNRVQELNQKNRE